MNIVYIDKTIADVNIHITKDMKMIRIVCKSPLNMVLFVGAKRRK